MENSTCYNYIKHLHLHFLCVFNITAIMQKYNEPLSFIPHSGQQCCSQREWGSGQTRVKIPSHYGHQDMIKRRSRLKWHPLYEGSSERTCAGNLWHYHEAARSVGGREGMEKEKGYKRRVSPQQEDHNRYQDDLRTLIEVRWDKSTSAVMLRQRITV